MNEVFSRTINVNTNFDVDGVIKGLQKVKDELSKKTNNEDLFTSVNASMKDLLKQYEKFKGYQQKGIFSNSEARDFGKTADKLSSSISTVLQELNKINSGKDIKNSTISALNNDIDTLKQKLQEVNDQYRQTKEQLVSKFTGIGFDKKSAAAIVAEVDSLEEVNAKLQEQIALKKDLNKENNKRIAEIDTLIADKKSTPISAKQLNNVISNSYFEDQSKKLSSNRTQLRDYAGSLIPDILQGSIATPDAWNKIIEKAKELNTALKIDTSNEAKNSYLNYIDQIKKSISDLIKEQDKLKQNFISTTVDGKEVYTPQAKEVLATAQILDQKKAERAALESQKKSLELQKQSAKTAEGPQTKQIDELSNSYENLSKNLEKAKVDTISLASSQNALDETFNHIASVITRFTSITNIFYQLRTVVNQTFQDIKNLDAAFASIAMVTNLSLSDLWDTYDQYAEIANKLGQSTKDVIEASALFYQQGLNTADSLALTESTMKLATLAGTNFKEATSEMTAALRGFHMEMDEGERITDVYSELAAKAAADVQGIATAISKTASIGA